MKGMKLSVGALCAAMLLSGCSMSNTAKGGLIGGGGGGALGALIGSIAGKGKGAAIGAAIGTAVGAGAGVIIGNKLDKAKKAAEAANAEAEIITDNNGNPVAMQATFPSGLLLATGNYALSSNAHSSLASFCKGIDSDLAISILGYSDNDPWKGSTAAESKEKNVQLSLQRANAVRDCLLKNGVASSQIQEVTGKGEADPVASNDTAEGKEKNRRVEVWVIVTNQTVQAANQAAGSK